MIAETVIATDLITPLGAYLRVRESGRASFLLESVARGRLGRYSFVGAGSVVLRDVPDHALVVGSPARAIGWVCRCGERLDVVDGSATCGRCRTRFARTAGGGVEPLE